MRWGTKNLKSEFFVDRRPDYDAANFRIEASTVARFIVCIEKKGKSLGLVFRLGLYEIPN